MENASIMVYGDSSAILINIICLTCVIFPFEMGTAERDKYKFAMAQLNHIVSCQFYRGVDRFVIVVSQT
ncbi:hypothetical protein D3C80_1905180 [compost metagenome]